MFCIWKKSPGHHMYLDVAGRSTTDLSMMLTDLQPLLYNCPDRHGVFANMQQAAGKKGVACANI